MSEISESIDFILSKYNFNDFESLVWDSSKLWIVDFREYTLFLSKKETLLKNISEPSSIERSPDILRVSPEKSNFINFPDGLTIVRV